MCSLVRDVPSTLCHRKDAALIRHKVWVDLKPHLQCDDYKKVHGDVFIANVKLVTVMGLILKKGFSLTIDRSGVTLVPSDIVIATVDMARKCTLQAPRADSSEVAGSSSGEGPIGDRPSGDRPSRDRPSGDENVDHDRPSTPGHVDTVDEDRGTYIPTNITFEVEFGRKVVTVENRDLDGWYRANGFYKGFDTEYAAKKEIDTIIAEMNSTSDRLFVSSTNLGAWVAPTMARALARRTGLSDEQITRAFEPQGKEPRRIGSQPVLDGELGTMLQHARQSRPLVPGCHVETEFVRCVDGAIVRTSGRYLDATLLFRSSNTTWKDFWSSQSHRTQLVKLAAKRRVAINDLIVPQTRTSERTRSSSVGDRLSLQGSVTGMWVDNDIGDKMVDWATQFIVRGERYLPGFLYNVTSPIVNAIKVGRWGGENVTKLRGRYATYYGPETQLRVFPTLDSHKAEKIAHSAMKGWCIGGELFEKKHRDEIANITNLAAQLIA
jgi:hypothetical protein